MNVQLAGKKIVSTHFDADSLNKISGKGNKTLYF